MAETKGSDDIAWHRIASDRGCSVHEAKEKVTPQEFMDWLSYWGKGIEDGRN